MEHHKIPAKDIHLMTVIRGCLYDLDAHLANVLWKKDSLEQLKLTHIDWDYCLPELNSGSASRGIAPKMGWRFFPQMDEPLSAEAIKCIQSINFAKDETLFQDWAKPISTKSLNLLFCTTKTFQKGVELGLTSGEIIDYLYSPWFVQAFVDAENDAEKDEVFDSSKISDTFSAYGESLNENRKKLTDLLQAVCSNPNRAVREVEDRIVFNKDYRVAVRIARQAIGANASDEDIRSMLKAFQNIANINQPLIYAALDALRDELNIQNRIQLSQDLSSWMKDTFC